MSRKGHTSKRERAAARQHSTTGRRANGTGRGEVTVLPGGVVQQGMLGRHGKARVVIDGHSCVIYKPGDAYQRRRGREDSSSGTHRRVTPEEEEERATRRQAGGDSG